MKNNNFNKATIDLMTRSLAFIVSESEDYEGLKFKFKLWLKLAREKRYIAV